MLILMASRDFVMEMHEFLTQSQTGDKKTDGLVAMRQVVLEILDEEAYEKYNSTPPDEKELLALHPEKGIVACWERAQAIVQADKGSAVWYVAIIWFTRCL